MKDHYFFLLLSLLAFSRLPAMEEKPNKKALTEMLYTQLDAVEEHLKNNNSHSNTIPNSLAYQWEIAKDLIARGADVNGQRSRMVVPNYGNDLGPLCFINDGFEVPLSRFMRYAPIVEFLLTHGADINRLYVVENGYIKEKQTVFHAFMGKNLNTIAQNDFDTFELLLKKGADLDSLNFCVRTPIELLLHKSFACWIFTKENKKKCTELSSFYKKVVQLYLHESRRRISNDVKNWLVELETVTSQNTYFKLLPPDLRTEFAQKIISSQPLDVGHANLALEYAQKLLPEATNATACVTLKDIIQMLEEFVHKSNRGQKRKIEK